MENETFGGKIDCVAILNQVQSTGMSSARMMSVAAMNEITVVATRAIAEKISRSRSSPRCWMRESSLSLAAAVIAGSRYQLRRLESVARPRSSADRAQASGACDRRSIRLGGTGRRASRHAWCRHFLLKTRGGIRMGIIAFLLIGLVAGFIARWLVPGPDPMGWLGTLILGIVGSFVGGTLAALIFGGTLELSAAGLIGSIIGAIIVLLIWRAMGGERRVTT